MKKTFFAVFLAIAVMLSLTMGMKWAIGAAEQAATFQEHVAIATCIDRGTEDLTGVSTSTVTTKCLYVDSCVVTIESLPATTLPTQMVCEIQTQTATSTRGMVDIQAVGASGTTGVSYIVMGRKRR